MAGPYRGLGRPMIMGPMMNPGGRDPDGGSGREVLEPLVEDPRHYEVYTGDAGTDGFVCEGRRPRVKGFDDIMDKEQADRIERIFNPDLRPDYSGPDNDDY